MSSSIHCSKAPTTPLPQTFQRKKAKILSELNVPFETYDDLSPKGSIDVGIRDVIDEINNCEGFVTTSSCAGRVSVFLEGVKKGGSEESEGTELGNVKGSSGEDEVDERVKPATLAAVGGKGGGGRWLFVSHDRVDVAAVEKGGIGNFLGIEEKGITRGENGALDEERLIHFKFEPMILHILAASLAHAQIILTAAFGAGFRESGALNLFHSGSDSEAAPTPMVAVRTMGLSLESVIGRHDPKTDNGVCFVSEDLLLGLINISNQRFVENTKRIERFRTLLKKGIASHLCGPPIKIKANGEEWEDADARKERKKAEGLRRAQELKDKALLSSINDENA